MSSTTMTREEQLEWGKNGNKILDVDGGVSQEYLDDAETRRIERIKDST